jgi:hypothetical protein
MNRMLSGPRSRSGGCGAEKISLSLAGIEARRPARRSWPVAIPTELSRLGWKENVNRKGEARWLKLGQNYETTEKHNQWADKPEAGTGSMKHWDSEKNNMRSKPKTQNVKERGSLNRTGEGGGLYLEIRGRVPHIRKAELKKKAEFPPWRSQRSAKRHSVTYQPEVICSCVSTAYVLQVILHSNSLSRHMVNTEWKFNYVITNSTVTKG